MAIPSYIGDFNSWKTGFDFRYPITVRFSETDMFGHLNNTNAFVYFEYGRINFFKDTGMTEEWFSNGGEKIPVTADLHCDFYKQVYFDEKLEVCVKVAHIGTSSVDIHYMILNEKGEMCISGRGTIVQVHRDTGKSCPWNEADMANLQKGVQ